MTTQPPESEPKNRWKGREPFEVIGILESRLAASHEEANRLAAHSQEQAARIAELRRAVMDTILAVEGLADQQAMPDNSWEPAVAAARAALAKEGG